MIEKRLGLKALRASRDMSQEELAAKLNVSRGTYADIENGVRDGSLDFWQNIEALFNLSSGEVWRLMKNATEEQPEVTQ